MFFSLRCSRRKEVHERIAHALTSKVATTHQLGGQHGEEGKESEEGEEGEEEALSRLRSLRLRVEDFFGLIRP